MDWNAATTWWVAAGALVAAELAVGTFYLLMLALGCAAGALAAHAGASAAWQITLASLVGAGATALWHFKRSRAPRSAPAEANRDVNLDIGEHIVVPAWNDDRSARVSYRGAAWNVQLRGTAPPRPGEHVIVAVIGNRLLVEPAAS